MMEKFFTPEIKKQADALLSRYETKRASILEILRLLQERHGFISVEAEQVVAEYLDIPPIDVHEVITFYSLFYKKQKCKTRFHVCRTLTCSLSGAETILKHFEEHYGLKPGEETENGQFSLNTVECLGACEIAPMMQLDDTEYVGHLTREKIDELMQKGS